MPFSIIGGNLHMKLLWLVLKTLDTVRLLAAPERSLNLLSHGDSQDLAMRDCSMDKLTRAPGKRKNEIVMHVVEQDEFDAFGNLVAVKLRRMDSNMQKLAITSINSILFPNDEAPQN
ncbi:uncharacterized protein LOC106671118 isoform X1 [Cimex lectularius]|uniref:Uncharacterized protein n=1 Tax=Cimex lectularius TaxID=79782 RepID=A0A8I6S596_CIMLE|nr:uncharacterized protein LOC106671118 isoform X1 [Cimex lectularius]